MLGFQFYTIILDSSTILGSLRTKAQKAINLLIILCQWGIMIRFYERELSQPYSNAAEPMFFAGCSLVFT